MPVKTRGDRRVPIRWRHFGAANVGIVVDVPVRWKSPDAVGQTDDPLLEFDPEQSPEEGVRRKPYIIGGAIVLVLAIAAPVVFSSPDNTPSSVGWCERTWQQSNSPAVAELPRRQDDLRWRPVQARGAMLHLPLASSSCPRNTPTVGYVEDSGQFYVYELQGGP